MYDLLTYLLNNSMRIIISSEDQLKLLKAITVLKRIILSMKTGIIDQSQEQKKKILQNKKMF